MLRKNSLDRATRFLICRIITSGFFAAAMDDFPSVPLFLSNLASFSRTTFSRSSRSCSFRSRGRTLPYPVAEPPRVVPSLVPGGESP